VEALAKKLGLSAEQQNKLNKMCADYDAKEDAIEGRLWPVYQDRFRAMNKELTEEQRAKLPEAMRAARENTWANFHRMLGLNREQEERMHKTHDEYAPKFRKLAETRDAKPADFRRLRHQEFAALGKELTEEQRAKLPLVIQEESQRWHTPEFQQEQIKLFSDKLGLSDEQKERIRKVNDEYASKLKEPTEELRKLYKAECDAMEGNLTEAQRNKLDELRKTIRRGKE
jgi:Spy/CpxP family protein refolding chaperone